MWALNKRFLEVSGAADNMYKIGSTITAMILFATYCAALLNTHVKSCNNLSVFVGQLELLHSH
jgi:hypothetical protein